MNHQVKSAASQHYGGLRQAKLQLKISLINLFLACVSTAVNVWFNTARTSNHKKTLSLRNNCCTHWRSSRAQTVLRSSQVVQEPVNSWRTAEMGRRLEKKNACVHTQRQMRRHITRRVRTFQKAADRAQCSSWQSSFGWCKIFIVRWFCGEKEEMKIETERWRVSQK